MTQIANRFTTLFFLLFSATTLSAAEWKLPQMVGKDNAGKPIYRAKPIDARFHNVWSDQYEREFQDRARRIIAAQAELKGGGGTYFENEKRFYGYQMAHVLGKDPVAAMKALQGEDAQAKDWHQHTEGIDYYAAFTLKHQMRKYFYFGDLMEPEYRKRMFEGAKKWTAKDPLRRPHHAYSKATGWGPDAKNSWVDVRSTENLFLMRVTSVYLMAEETGNRETTAAYKQIILNYAKSLYRVGMGEWDSENYHGHSMTPLYNLYDFSQDAEVKFAAKACLDWLCAAGAVKYFRGGFNGPGSRDYNHAQPFGGSAPSMLWIYFGDTKQMPDHWESDEVHAITSSYRPPLAVMSLARNDFPKPVDIFASKPEYTASTAFLTEAAPAYLETHHIAHTFQLGTLSCGTPPGVSSVNGFKIIARDRTNDCLLLQAAPTRDPQFVGSPLYQDGKITAQNRVAHVGNTAIWLAKGGKTPWLWVVPESVKVITNKGITFLECDETWVAIRPLGTTPFAQDAALTRQTVEAKKTHFPGHQAIFAEGKAKSFCGFAVQVAEKQSHKSFANFQAAAHAAELDVSQLEEGIVKLNTADGKHLGFHWNDDPANLGVWRNGKRHDWEEHADYVYRTGDATEPGGLIFSPRGAGVLHVNAGGKTFRSEVAADGKVSFE